MSGQFQFDYPLNQDIPIIFVCSCACVVGTDTLQETISKTTSDHQHKVYLESNEGSVVKLQSAFRGYAKRKQYKDRLNYLKEQEPEVVKLQVSI